MNQFDPLPMWPTRVASSIPPVSALEVSFPSAVISRLAEVESWRKEIHRPATHTHKWWAQRLGTVFRAILAAAVSEPHEALTTYSAATSMEGLRIYDPFAGSGTTLVEGAKAGATVIGCDINPVATLVQRQALAAWDESTLTTAFKAVEGASRTEIDQLHVDAHGQPILYYFWVAVAQCPTCAIDVELFSSYVFARHAYPKKFPDAKATCPDCHAVVAVNLATDTESTCAECACRFLLAGAVSGQTMTCRSGHPHRVIQALNGARPRYRMYAKLVCTASGKSYQSIDRFDIDLYERAAELLVAASPGQLVQPNGRLEDGYNTAQAMRWGFHQWRDFFNERQLYSLGVLGAAIRDLDCEPNEREALSALFSGTLEFNNLFCSFKGEGTGAVRHMFSHHVLKPERTPLEAHPWGTPASSGSFSTLFESRLLRAHRYKAAPFDLIPGAKPEGSRVTGLSAPLGHAFGRSAAVEVFTGDSSHTHLASESVDLVVTDPPYMDNVHYSELADFFHAWLREIRPFDEYPVTPSTRDGAEVQDTTAIGFAASIENVWKESARVLKPTGLLAFTFHQAKIEGWVAVMTALRSADLTVTSMQPVKGDMSVAAPKHGAREPSTLDTIVVCRKRGHGATSIGQSPQDAATWAEERLSELRDGGVTFGVGDIRSVVRGCVLSLITSSEHADVAILTEVADELASDLVARFDPTSATVEAAAG